MAIVRDPGIRTSRSPHSRRTQRLRAWRSARPLRRRAAATHRRQSHLLKEIFMRVTAEELVEKAKQHIEYTKDKKNRIATLTFNRPKQFNATTVGMRLLYGDLIHRANIDDDVKVLVVRGAGDHLGTGGDLNEQNGAYADSDGEGPSLLH